MAPDVRASGQAKAGTVRGAAGSQAAYLEETRNCLWPDAVVGTRGAGLLAVPTVARPRIVVPRDRRAAATAVRHYGEPGSRRTRAARSVLSVLLRAGFGPVIGEPLASSGAGTVESYLREQLDTDLRVSMHVGAPRANRKPVLQLLTPAGATAGFAKIGVTPLSRRLIRAEHATLVRLRDSALTTLSVPDVLLLGSWHGHDVLVLGPLPVWEARRPVTGGGLAAAMTEVADVHGTASAPLGRSSFWAHLRQRLAGCEDSADREGLVRVSDRLLASAGEVELRFGSWHGDWTPWNMASVRRGLLVWDWERFAPGVPRGFDALHYWLQSRVVSPKVSPQQAARECVTRAPRILDPLKADARCAQLTALSYLLELSVRYLEDQQAEAGARLGSPGQWLTPAIAACLPAVSG